MGTPAIRTGSDTKTPVFAPDGPSGQAAVPMQSADGDQVTLGAKADAAASTDIGTFSLIALIKRLLQKLTAGLSVTVTASNVSGATGSTVPSQATLVGASDGTNMQAVRVPTVFKYTGLQSLAAGGTWTAWTPATNKKIRLMGYCYAVQGAANVILKDGASGTSFATIQTAGVDTRAVDMRQGRPFAAANNVLEIFNNGGGTTVVALMAWGTEE